MAPAVERVVAVAADEQIGPVLERTTDQRVVA
jgi:hypothetical protein